MGGRITPAIAGSPPPRTRVLTDSPKGDFVIAGYEPQSSDDLPTTPSDNTRRQHTKALVHQWNFAPRDVTHPWIPSHTFSQSNVQMKPLTKAHPRSTIEQLRQEQQPAKPAPQNAKQAFGPLVFHTRVAVESTTSRLALRPVTEVSYKTATAVLEPSIAPHEEMAKFINFIANAGPAVGRELLGFFSLGELEILTSNPELEQACANLRVVFDDLRAAALKQPVRNERLRDFLNNFPNDVDPDRALSLATTHAEVTTALRAIVETDPSWDRTSSNLRCLVPILLLTELGCMGVMSYGVSQASGPNKDADEAIFGTFIAVFSLCVLGTLAGARREYRRLSRLDQNAIGLALVRVAEAGKTEDANSAAAQDGALVARGTAGKPDDDVVIHIPYGDAADPGDQTPPTTASGFSGQGSSSSSSSFLS